MPNAGRGLVRHKYRTEEWDPAFREYLKSLDAKKPVVMCGDLNVAHQEIGKLKILFILWTHDTLNFVFLCYTYCFDVYLVYITVN